MSTKSIRPGPWDNDASRFGAETIIMLTLRGDRSEELTAFRTPARFPRLGLPEHLPT